MADIVKLSLNGMEDAIKVILESDHTPAVVGGAGIGKTEKLSQIATRDGSLFKSITCSLMQEGDLMLPIPKQATAEQEANNLRVVSRAIDEDIVQIIEFLNDPENEGKYAYLLLDELNRASTAVQGELMNLVLAKELKGVKIPENCRILVAMNPSSDMSDEYSDTNYAVNSGDSAIMDRMTYIFVEPTVEEWAEWGAQINPKTGLPKVDIRVVEFLQSDPIIGTEGNGGETNLFNMKEVEGKIGGTPRSWARASDHLTDCDRLGITSNVVRHALITGAVGYEAGEQFMSFIQNYDTNITLAEILDTSDQLNEAVIRKYDASSALRKTAVLKNIIRKVNSDLVALAETPREQQPAPERFAYLEHNVIAKFLDLNRKLAGDASDTSTVVFQYANEKKEFWEFGKQNPEFGQLALAVRIENT